MKRVIKECVEYKGYIIIVTEYGFYDESAKKMFPDYHCGYISGSYHVENAMNDIDSVTIDDINVDFFGGMENEIKIINMNIDVDYNFYGFDTNHSYNNKEDKTFDSVFNKCKQIVDLCEVKND